VDGVIAVEGFEDGHFVRVRRFSVAPEVFALAPSYRRRTLFAMGSQASADERLIAEWLGDAVNAVRATYGSDDVPLNSTVAQWRSVFRDTGVNPGKFRSSLEATLRRAVDGQLKPLGLALVDVGTIATLRHLVPIGVHVLDELPLAELILAPASGREIFEPLEGPVQAPEAGEIVYKCEDRVLTRRWVWRQGRYGSVTTTSRMVAINIDLLAPTNEDEIVRDLTALLGSVGYELLDEIVLDRQSPTAVVV
jgi:DNA/RNA-binding domain of Phe-tRNA-synthetase-like protein